jgi:hypothetical protein
MTDSPFDYAHRAAEAFMAANRSEDPAEAARLRREAYRLVELIREQEQLSIASSGAEGERLAWGDVMIPQQRA